MIKIAIRFHDDRVAVFEKNGDLPPRYQGQYHHVKGRIQRDAPPDAVFAYGRKGCAELTKVPRGEW